jgi:hypothetical protein
MMIFAECRRLRAIHHTELTHLGIDNGPPHRVTQLAIDNGLPHEHRPPIADDSQ